MPTRFATRNNPNPLNKIPALELKSGQLIVDSKVICEYLIKLTNQTDLMPECRRIESLIRIALADGITEATLLMIYEQRFEKQSQVNTDWLHRQNEKVIGGLIGSTVNLQMFHRLQRLIRLGSPSLLAISIFALLENGGNDLPILPFG